VCLDWGVEKKERKRKRVESDVTWIKGK